MSTTNLYIETPLIHSQPLSKQYNRDVYLKLELLQPSGSFKLRGMSYMIQKAIGNGYTEFICSSGGNAGLAAAFVCSVLKLKCTVCVPSTTPTFIIQKLQSLGAVVNIHGAIWAEADQLAREIMNEVQLEEGKNKPFYVSPFDHEDLWTGASSLVDEIMTQLPHATRLNPNPHGKGSPEVVQPAAIAVAVGGGGLLNGICQGIIKHGLQDKTHVLTTETIGSCCFATAVKNDAPTKVNINSIATSLGASIISQRSFDYSKELNITPIIVSDAECVNGITQLLNQHNLLVEPSCGSVIAGLSAIFDEKYRQEIQQFKDNTETFFDATTHRNATTEDGESNLKTKNHQHCQLLSCTIGENTPYSNVHMQEHVREHINDRFLERLVPQLEQHQWAREVPIALQQNEENDNTNKDGPIVVIVCGGSLISPQMLRHYQHLTQSKHYCREHDVGYGWIEENEALNKMVRK